MKFKEWFFNEISTSTGCIAMFARPMIGVVKRQFVAPIGDDLLTEEPPKDKKKKKKQ